MKRLQSIDNILYPLGLVLALLAGWELAVRWWAVPEWLLPGPSRIARTLVAAWPDLMKHAPSTIAETLLGFGVAVVLAFAVALLMDEVAVVKKSLYPLIIASQTVPIVSVAPLFIIWFGYGMLPKVIVVVLVCFFPVAISLLGGLAAIDPDYLDLFRSMKASRAAMIRMVKLPLALPSFFSGLKISAAYSVMGAVIGEWLGAEKGLGNYITLSQHSFQTDRVFVAIIAITLLSLLLFAVISLLEAILIPWQRLGKE